MSTALLAAWWLLVAYLASRGLVDMREGGTSPDTVMALAGGVVIVGGVLYAWRVDRRQND